MIKRKIAIEREIKLLSEPHLYRRHIITAAEFSSQAEDFLVQYFGGAHEISVICDYDFLSVSPRCFAAILKIAMQRKFDSDIVRIRIHAGRKTSEIAIEFDTSRLEAANIETITRLAEFSGHKVSITEFSITISSPIEPVTVLEVYAGNAKIVLHALEEIFLY